MDINKIKEADAVRGQWAEGDAKRDAGIKPASVVAKTNIIYTDSEKDEDRVWHLADIYYPENIKCDRFPVIISVHGGGWFYGDKELYSLYTRFLASNGFAVVNFNYRRSPESPYPAAFEDVCRLADHIYSHAAEYNLDPDRIFMAGDSCGAQLVSQYCVFACSSEYRKLFPQLGGIKTPVPLGTALNCGIYDINPEKDEMICGWYLPENMSPDLSESAFRILDYMNADFPPSYVMVSINDPLKVRTESLLKRFEELGISFVYREFGKVTETDGHVFHLNLRSIDGAICNMEELEFFREKI